MNGVRAACCLAALLAANLARAAQPAPPVVVRTDDVERFYRVYDAAEGHPTAAQLQAQYLAPGSEALHQFVVSRVGNADKLVDAIARRPADFEKARGCLSALAKTQAQLPAVFSRMAARYPASMFPPVIFVIGRDNTGGTTTADGIVIGLETMCRVAIQDTDVGERFTHIIAHELVHVQQPAGQVDAPPDATLLFQALLEGGADFVAELTSGGTANPQLQQWTAGQECAIEQAFEKEALGTDISRWMYNGVGTPDKPGDLGYWVGYRIAKTYYEHAANKKAAIAALLTLDNASAPRFLKKSGWKPQSGC